MLQSKERERGERGEKALEDADLGDPRATQNHMSCDGFTLM